MIALALVTLASCRALPDRARETVMLAAAVLVLRSRA